MVLPRDRTAISAYSGDRLTLALLYPTLKEIIDCHVRGTHFGIHVDERDGLLAQGAPGYQLTWMDAKVDDWVVTPRRGKAVEINALWYNALQLMEGWAAEHGDPRPPTTGARAERACAIVQRALLVRERRLSLRRRRHGGGRPRQSTTRSAGRIRCSPIALPHPVLARERWEPVVRTVRDRLLTPVGLRSLAPGDPDFKARYFGDLRARDAAYHQGTVWAWLVGPFVDAWLKVYPDDHRRRAARRRGLRPASRRCVHRIDQRGVRRRAAVHAARLHRAGVERG